MLVKYKFQKKVQNQTICDYPHYSFSGLNITKTVSFLEKKPNTTEYICTWVIVLCGEKKQKNKKTQASKQLNIQENSSINSETPSLYIL